MSKEWLEIVTRYGLDEQLKHWFGEIFELIQAIYNDDGSMVSREHITEELADNYNFLGQVQTYFNIADEEVKKVQRFKNARTLNLSDFKEVK